MAEVLEEKRLRIVSYCHLPFIQIRVPHIPPDPKLFPAAKGFEDYSVATVVGWFGAKYALVDVSGLTRSEVTKQAHAGFWSKAQVEAIRFFQCLDWIHSGTYVDKFAFERIVAYPICSEPVVAIHTDAGFERVQYLGDETPWEPGTLCLLSIDSL